MSNMKFAPMPLPYSEDALEPTMSQECVNLHYNKHHWGYTKKYNQLMESQKQLAEYKTLEEVIHKENPETSKGFNLAAQIYNHNFFWQNLKPNKQVNQMPMPKGQLLERINKDFGSFQEFRNKFISIAENHFASGWNWLCWCNTEQCLKIRDLHDARNPLIEKRIPLMTVDLWEHAFYVDYKSDKRQYLEKIWNIINWDFAEEQFEKHCKQEK